MKDSTIQLLVAFCIVILLAVVISNLDLKKDSPKPSGEDVSGGYTVSDPCSKIDCNLGK